MRLPPVQSGGERDKIETVRTASATNDGEGGGNEV